MIHTCYKDICGRVKSGVPIRSSRVVTELNTPGSNLHRNQLLSLQYSRHTRYLSTSLWRTISYQSEVSGSRSCSGARLFSSYNESSDGEHEQIESNDNNLLSLLSGEHLGEQVLDDNEVNSALNHSEDSSSDLLSLLAPSSDTTSTQLDDTRGSNKDHDEWEQFDTNERIKLDTIKPSARNLPSPQTRENAKVLFESIAPHVDFRLLTMLITRLKQFDTTLQKEKQAIGNDTKENQFSTVIGLIDSVFIKKGKTLTIDPWVRSLIAQFVSWDGSDYYTSIEDGSASVGDRSDVMPTVLTNYRMLSPNPSYPPTRNRKNFDSNVALLMKAREASRVSPLLWSKGQRKRLRQSKKVSETNDELSHVDKDDTDTSLEESNQESISNNNQAYQELKIEAEYMARILADRLPPSAHDKLLKRLREYVKAIEDEAGIAFMSQDSNDDVSTGSSRNKKKKSQKMQMLFPNLKKHTKQHLHLVAYDLAKFLHVEIADAVHFSKPTSDDELSTTISHISSNAVTDPRIKEVWNKWNAVQEEVIDALLKAQHSYCLLQSEMKGRGETIESDLILDEIKKSQQKEKAPRERKRKQINATFDCFMTNTTASYDQSSCSHDQDVATMSSHLESALSKRLPNTSRIILLENLPIDITEEELSLLYSRCGPVKSVEIFNRRPFLDPGELSLEEKKINREKRLGARAANRVETRRTPVYAKIEFEDDDGYKTATMDMLRIFGMVIRRHPVRSIPAQDVKSLYIENIQPGYKSTKIAEMLDDLFHPHMYVVLSMKGSSPNVKPTCCEIRFPSFEIASHAYEILRDVDFGDENCDLNWMKTPGNAVDFWTRNFTPYH